MTKLIPGLLFCISILAGFLWLIHQEKWLGAIGAALFMLLPYTKSKKLAAKLEDDPENKSLQKTLRFWQSLYPWN